MKSKNIRNQGWVSEKNRSRIAEIVAALSAIVAAETNRSCPFLKKQNVSQKMKIRIAVYDIAANQISEIGLFKYHTYKFREGSGHYLQAN